MADPRFAIPLEELVAGAQVAREEQVEVQADVPVPPATGPDALRYGDGMSGDVDGD
ncbi:hypothetical protein [Candidatus Blastococcus massiliensis]|uniref:hypothetical protein n=1 Tax=Candidatus Blastococcus massiliensis TaxID=1470358 RepID=UPI0004B329EC|nr:hypothetical protein [Candidatus Blastococcus massiliensis]